MDEIHAIVETSVRRAAALGALLIATIAATLASHPRLALDVAATLSGLEALALWQLSLAAPRLPFGLMESWLHLPGTARRLRPLFTAMLGEALHGAARRMTIPAALAWGADVAVRIFA